MLLLIRSLYGKEDRLRLMIQIFIGKSADYNFANYVKDLLYDKMDGLNVQTGPTSEAAQKIV